MAQTLHDAGDDARPAGDPRSAREALRDAVAAGAGARPPPALYDAMEVPGPYTPDADAAGRRALRLAALSLPDPARRRRRAARAQFATADNMTEQTRRAVRACWTSAQGEAELQRLPRPVAGRPAGDGQVVRAPGRARRARAAPPRRRARLTEHPDFDWKNPNRFRAVAGRAGRCNPAGFHDPSGAVLRAAGGLADPARPAEPADHRADDARPSRPGALRRRPAGADPRASWSASSATPGLSAATRPRWSAASSDSLTGGALPPHAAVSPARRNRPGAPAVLGSNHQARTEAFMPKIDAAKILILATNGFEQSELVAPRDELRKAGATVHVATPDGDAIPAGTRPTGATRSRPTCASRDVKVEDYDALVLPGGQINPDILRTIPEAVKLVRDFAEAGKVVAAICHGPWLLVEADVVQGTRRDLLPLDPHRPEERRRQRGRRGSRRATTASSPAATPTTCRPSWPRSSRRSRKAATSAQVA